MESIIGQSYSYETQGWAVMMNAYKIIMNATRAPGYQIFAQDGTTTDYQGMRYGLTSCLMDNAYYYFNVTGQARLHHHAGSTSSMPTWGLRLAGAVLGWHDDRLSEWRIPSGLPERHRAREPQRQRHSDRDSGNELQASFRNAGALCQ